MATKKSTIVIISILTLVVGYVLGGLIGLPPTNSDRLSGDIGKVNKHKNNVVNESEALIEQKLRTDSTFMAQTTYTLAFISARIGEFKENAALTSEVVADYPQVQKYQQSMSDLAAVAANAEVSAASALEALSKISLGQEGVSYEEFSNNAILSYLILEKGLNTSTDFVNDADAFLKGKKLVDYQSLAFVRDIWVNYNLITAVLNEDNALVNHWNKAGNKLTPDQSKLALVNANATFQNNVSVASLFNAQVLANASSKLNVFDHFANHYLLNIQESALNVIGGMYYYGVVIQNNGKLGLCNKSSDLGSQSQVSMCMFPADLHANVVIAVNAKLGANANNLGATSKDNLGVNTKDNLGSKAQENLGLSYDMINMAQYSLNNGAQISGALSNSQLLGIFANQKLLSATSSQDQLNHKIR